MIGLAFRAYRVAVAGVFSPLLGTRSEFSADSKERNSKLEKDGVDPALSSLELAHSKVFFDPVKYHWTLMYPTIM